MALVLRDLSMSIVSINSRIFSTLLIGFGGYFFFDQIVSVREFWGLLLGILVFVFLFDSNDKPRAQSCFGRGIALLGVMILGLAIGNSLHLVALAYFAEYLVILLATSSALFSFEILFRVLREPQKLQTVLSLPQIWILSGIIAATLTANTIFLIQALGLHSMVIVYKIFSFEILSRSCFRSSFFAKK